MTAVSQTLADDHPSRWRMLGLLAAAELLGMSLWFAGKRRRAAARAAVVAVAQRRPHG